MAVQQTAATQDILINQGDDFRQQFRLCTGTSDSHTPVDITGYTFSSKIRSTTNSKCVLAKAQCTIIDAKDGVMEVFFSDSETGQIPTDGERYDETSEYSWDIYATEPDGDTYRIVNGSCYVSPGVSFD